MKHETISKLKNYLYQDTDFNDLFKQRFPRSFILEYGNAIDSFIDSMAYDSTIDFYILDKCYLDLAWLKIDNDIINMDDLYLDWKSFIQEYQR